MSYLEIRQRIEALCKLGGWSNVQPEPDYAFITAWAYRTFVRETSGNVEDYFISTVTGQVSYKTIQDNPALAAYDPRVWCNFWDSTLYGYVAGAPGSSWPLPQTTRNDLRNWDPMYNDIAPSLPVFWYFDKGNTNTIALYPPPSNTGDVMKFVGIRELPPMVNDDDKTPFSEIYDEAIALFGAAYQGKLYTRGNERAIANQYHAEAMEMVTTFKNEVAGTESALVNRRVQLPRQEYVLGGTRQLPIYQTPAWNGSQSNG